MLFRVIPFLTVILTGFLLPFNAVYQSVTEIQKFAVDEAKQGVAVDERFFYVINNSTISKHTKPEVYVMKLPASGYTLEQVATLPAPIHGQGIAIDHSRKDKLILYGIVRAANTISVSEIK